MDCESEFEEKELARERYGEDSPQYHLAMQRYVFCAAAVQAARDAHAQGWDERLIEQWEAWRALWETIMGQIDRPPRPDLERRSIELRNKIFADVETALIFSEGIENAFRESGIQLEEDETFACFVYVRERPTDVSEVISPTFLASHPEARSPLSIIMEPETMRRLMEALEKDEYAAARLS